VSRPRVVATYTDLGADRRGGPLHRRATILRQLACRTEFDAPARRLLARADALDHLCACLTHEEHLSRCATLPR